MIVLTVLIMLSIASCKGAKEKQKMPNEDISKNVSAFATIPSCLEMYRVLDTKQNVDFSGILPTRLLPAVSDTTGLAVWTGITFADAILTSKAANRAKLMEYQIALSKIPFKDPSLEHSVAEFGKLLRDNDLALIQKATTHLMDLYESYWWQRGDFASYTMMVTAAWATTAYRISKLAKDRYPAEATAIIGHRQAWISISNNLKLLSGSPFSGSDIYKAAVDMSNKIVALIPDSGQGGLDVSSLDGIITTTGTFLSTMGYDKPQ